MVRDLSKNNELILEARNLTKQFRVSKNNTLTACDSINLSMYKGKTLGIVGESGCGKSTFLRMLMNLEPISSGEIFYKGKDISKFSKDEIWESRQHIQMVYQDPGASFNPRMKVVDILTEPLINYDRLKKEDKEKKEKIEVLVGKSEEYSMIKEEALNDFVTILEEYKIEDMYFQNPPKLIFEMLKKSYKKKEIKIEYFEFKDIDEKIILEINSKFDTKIIGQNNVKEKLLINLYSNIKKLKTKPLILMFYGPSGVGKTETAKYLSEILGEKLFRKQFSMYQNNSFFDYVFGEKHGISSLARDLLNRESNVILFDEFDKAESTFYSAFYQLFDEGILIDKNYEVKLKNSIIICTSNYRNLLDIKKKLGEAIYSRFDDFIEFSYFTI